MQQLITNSTLVRVLTLISLVLDGKENERAQFDWKSKFTVQLDNSKFWGALFKLEMNLGSYIWKSQKNFNRLQRLMLMHWKVFFFDRLNDAFFNQVMLRNSYWHILSLSHRVIWIRLRWKVWIIYVHTFRIFLMNLNSRNIKVMHKWLESYCFWHHQSHTGPSLEWSVLFIMLLLH